MIPYNWLDIARIIVRERQQDTVRNAEQARVSTEVPNVGSGPIAAIRRQVGTAMVRAGEYIQGGRRSEVATSQPRGSTLRATR